jgi:TRAP-type C4-dicarboxylate transport system permease small subunit
MDRRQALSRGCSSSCARAGGWRAFVLTTLPEDAMPPKIARLAGLGAFSACAAFVALFLYVAYISRHTLTGGMMPALSVVTWISLGIVVLALIGAHVAIGRQLLAVADGRPRRV